MSRQAIGIGLGLVGVSGSRPAQPLDHSRGPEAVVVVATTQTDADHTPSRERPSR